MSASWIKKLAESDSRLHKESVLREALVAAKLGNDASKHLLTGLQYCYNPYLTFGIKQIPNSVGVTKNKDDAFFSFMTLAGQLINRRLTGHNARDAVAALSKEFSSEEWNYFIAPIFRRDMRCGVSVKTINKVMKGTPYTIPVFGCQLATNSEGRPEMKGKKRLEPKLDGVRVLLCVTPTESNHGTVWGNTACYSRNGKIFDNFTIIESEVSTLTDALVKKYPEFKDGFVLDGEVMGESFQQLMRQARRKSNVNSDDSIFHIFDILPLNEFKAGIWKKKLSDRIDILQSLKSEIATRDHLELLPHIEVDLDTAEGREQLDDYADSMVQLGYEGIMIKDLDSPYECDRTTAWLKWKPTITVDLIVIRAEEGTGKNKGRLGALVCHGWEGAKEIEVNVGSGYTDEERIEFWNILDQVLGRTIEVLADAITQNKDGSYSLRFPRFVRFRDDKHEE